MSQRYLEICFDELGVHETPGTDCTERIKEYASHTTLHATSDEIAWCSSFANWVVDNAGNTGTHSAAARSWLGWGKALSTPISGCIVVLDRKTKENPNSAHVTFFVCKDTDPAYFQAIGGNQGDAVKRSRFPFRDVLGFRDI